MFVHTNFQNIVKADKQTTHKQFIANLCNDPDHSEPFDVTLLVATDSYV